MADFESILDDCLREIAAGHETLESCLRRYPAHAARLAPVLNVAERLRRVPPAPAMPADKRRVLESRYLRRAAQLHLQPAQRVAAPQRGLRRGWVPVFAAFLVCLIVATTITTASASVPGDVLYPVKRTD